MKLKQWSLLAALTVTLPLAACGGDDGASSTEGGSVFVTGSSTVEPISIKVGELAGTAEGGNLKVTVEGPGTGDGFKKFCAGETDISNASRAIKDEEAAECAAAGIEFTEIIVANDALTVVVSKENDWAKCLTVDELKKMWEPTALTTFMGEHSCKCYPFWE